ncbi:hypothetical protein Tco_0970547 [Tanacetum coccineum]
MIIQKTTMDPTAPSNRQNVAQRYNMGTGEVHMGALAQVHQVPSSHNGRALKDATSMGNPKGMVVLSVGSRTNSQRDCPKLKNKMEEMGMPMDGFNAVWECREEGKCTRGIPMCKCRPGIESCCLRRQDILLRAKVKKLKFVENRNSCDEVESLKERNTTLEKEKSVLYVSVSDLAATVKVREQEAANSDAMVTAVKLQNDKLADQRPNSEYSVEGRLRSFKMSDGAAISRAIEKGMQDGLAAGIEHGAHGRSLEDLVAYNPSAEEDYIMPL